MPLPLPLLPLLFPLLPLPLLAAARCCYSGDTAPEDGSMLVMPRRSRS